MDIIKLTARPRSGNSKSYNRNLRQNGWIPAIYYGHNFTPRKIEVNYNEFIKLVRDKKTRNLFNLGLEEKDGNESVAIIKEIQRDLINRKKILHIDFQRVSMNEKVVVDVPVELIGLPPIGVKEMGGVLQHAAKKIKIECLPGNIPEKIQVDVSMLKIGDSIHIRDIKVTNAVIKDSPDEVVAVVIVPTKEEVKAPEPTAAGAEGAAPQQAAGEAAQPAATSPEGTGKAQGAASAESKEAKPPAKDTKQSKTGGKEK